MKASDYIADFLEIQGVSHVYEVIGGMITFLLDSIDRKGKIKLVSVHHEQAASFAADAYGRIKGIPGVAMATSGPGATNLLTGIASCYFDSVPCVFITGQVNTHEQRGDNKVRQLGFQETDIVSMAKPITKAAWLVNNSEDLPSILEQAFLIALSGRPGPVLVDIPMNVQRANIEYQPRRVFAIAEENNKLQFLQLENLINGAERPLILAGGGMHSSNSWCLFKKFVENVKIPVVSSLMAVDALPYDSTYRAGFLGSYGNRWTNKAIGLCDLLIVLGSRLDIRQTGADVEGFQKGRTIVHVDVDEAEINNRLRDCLKIHSELKTFLNKAISYFQSKSLKSFSSWIQTIHKLKDTYLDTEEIKGIEGINPNDFMHLLSKSSNQAAGYTIDVGQHQMWAAQSLELQDHQRFLTSGGMGAMGYALPAAIGCCHAHSSKPVVTISGDGGFQLNIQELETIAFHQLPIKIIVINNGCHGMVRQFQQSYFNERYTSTKKGYSAPKFSEIAVAYGITSMKINKTSEIKNALQSMWLNPFAPFMLEVEINYLNNAYPKIAFGQPMTEMEPDAKPLDMEGT